MRKRTVRTLLKQNIGFALMCLGAMGGDSNYLIIPIVVILMGIALIRC